MKERPILFSGPMVRAILEGRKTQTRRMVKPQPDKDFDITKAEIHDYDDGWGYGFWDGDMHFFKCPYGQPGEVLWVRETLRRSDIGAPTRYAADDCPVFQDGETPTTWPFKNSILPSIFMPRWASRITLEVVSVRVERLQEISEEDAAAEGIIQRPEYTAPFNHELYKDLWDSINGKKHPWDSNPWVWVVEFRPVAPTPTHLISELIPVEATA